MTTDTSNTEENKQNTIQTKGKPICPFLLINQQTVTEAFLKYKPDLGFDIELFPRMFEYEVKKIIHQMKIDHKIKHDQYLVELKEWEKENAEATGSL